MKKEEAIKIIKQLIDAAIKGGICQNLEATAIIYQAYQIILNELKNGSE